MTDTYWLVCAACGAEHRVPHGATHQGQRCPGCGALLIASLCQPIPVTDAEWEAEVAGGTAPAVVVAAGRACGTCAAYEASVRLMAVHFYGKARVLWLNLDESPRIAARYQVTGVPTVLLFRDGQFLDRLPGPRGEQGLAERLGLG